MKRMVLLILLLGGALHAQETRLMPGDLLFYVDTEGMGAAVKESTGRYTHVAMVVEVGDTVWIVDATQRFGVSRRPESSVKPYPDVYRLTVSFDTAAVIARATALVGKPYDNAFLPDNDAYYCSELIQTVFNQTIKQSSNQAIDIFPSQPMNWRDAKGKLPKYWKNHFRKLGMKIPEGVPGTNPTDLSRSPLLQKL